MAILYTHFQQILKFAVRCVIQHIFYMNNNTTELGHEVPDCTVGF